MKLLKYLILAALPLAFASCDNVDENDRYIDAGEIPPLRTVLLEEFTGQLCTNCPQGHKIASDLRARFGSNFIPVSIHASTLALSEEYGGFSNAESEKYYNNVGNPSLPSGVVDRKTGTIDRSAWTQAVLDDIRILAPVDLSISSSFDSSTGTIEATVSATEVTNTLTGTLQVWLVQNNITAFQTDGGNYVTDYVHNHIFRSSLNGTDGESVTVSNPGPLGKTYSIKLKDAWKTEGWKPEDFSVVAFITDATGVVNAAESQVRTN